MELDITLQFLTLLDPDEAMTRNECWCAYQDRPDADLYPKQVHSSFANVFERLPELGEMGYGLFMCVNAIEPRSEMRRSKWGKLYEADTRYVSQITRVRAVFGDFDNPKVPLPAFALPPSIIVETSPGKHHVYWLADPADPLPVEEFDTVQRSIIGAYALNGADKSMLSPNHILRLPGSLHRKDEPRLVRIVDAAGHRYGARELRGAFRPPKHNGQTLAKYPPQYYNLDVQPLLEYIDRQWGPPRPDGAYNVGCPWSSEHTTQNESASASTYWPPSREREWGGFKCLHSHCAERSVIDFHNAIRSQIHKAGLRLIK